jgi:hypothetical protein
VENQLAYSFDSTQKADRFLNRLKAGAVAHVRVRRYQGGTCIAVNYHTPADATFDTTCQQLDDLAARFGGNEITL